MPVQPIVRSIVRPTVTGIVRSFGSSFVSRFGTDLTAAYFLADLGSKRGTVDGVLNPVVRVRRTNGDLRAFTANDITTGVLLAWVGTGGSDNGLVAKLYDGSGNHHDATQDTVANMPKIVDAGVLIVDSGGKPGFRYDGSNDSFGLASPLNIGSTNSVFFIFEQDQVDSAVILLSSDESGGQGTSQIDVRSSGVNYRIGGSTENNIISATTNMNEHNLFSFIRPTSSSFSAWRNGAFLGTDASTMTADSVFQFIGSNSTATIDGVISAIAIYDTSKTTDRPAIETALAKEYNITLA